MINSRNLIYTNILDLTLERIQDSLLRVGEGNSFNVVVIAQRSCDRSTFVISQRTGLWKSAAFAH